MPLLLFVLVKKAQVIDTMLFCIIQLKSIKRMLNTITSQLDNDNTLFA